MDSVVINFKWTANDLIAARRWHFRHVCRPAFRLAAHIVIILVMSASILSIAYIGLSALPVGLLLLGIYIYFIRPFEARWNTRRQFAKRPDRDCDIQWTVSPDRLTVKATLGNSDFSWAALSKVILTPDGFLFYPNDQIFHFIPRRGFQSDEDYCYLMKLSKTHTQKFIELF